VPSSLIDAFTRVRAVPSERFVELQGSLERSLGAARSAHPEIAIEPARFIAHLASVLDPRDEPLAALELIRPGALWLALACGLHSQRALAELERKHLSRVPAFIARVDRSPDFADEVLQLLRTQLLVAAPNRAPGILAYSGRGELDGWLRVLALRTAWRQRRSQPGAAVQPDEDGMPELGALGDPERDHLKMRYRDDYREALKSALGKLAVRERLFLKLHYADGLNIDKIGQLYQLHRSTVARRLAEHRRRVLELTREELRARLRLTDSEFDSVLALVRSQLAISVREVLS
jgi:RNA polymerase sigma-70 factor (ECF subfamily)